MKKLNRLLAIGITTLSLGAACFSTNALAADKTQQKATTQTSAQAPDDGCPYGGPGPGPRPMDPAARKEAHQKHMEALHTKLKLNKEQEKAWTTFVADTEKNLESRKPPMKPEEFNKLSAPERLQSMIDMRKQDIKGMENHLSSLKTFYGTLTAEQKKTFDEEAKPRPPRGPRGEAPKDASEKASAKK